MSLAMQILHIWKVQKNIPYRRRTRVGLQHFPLSPMLSRDKIHTQRPLPLNFYLLRPRFLGRTWPDQTRVSLSQTGRREKRDPGNEVGTTAGPLFEYLSGVPLTKVGLTSETSVCLVFSHLSMLDTAIGLGPLLPLLLWAFPPGLLKHLGVGPRTVMKDTFIAHMLFCSGFHVRCCMIHLIKKKLLALGFVSSMGNTLCVFVGMKCSHTGHAWPHRLTEWMGCHGNHESKLPKDLSQGIVTPGEEWGVLTPPPIRIGLYFTVNHFPGIEHESCVNSCLRC